ncbi:MAG: hypothetical protein N3A38_09975, partial [Planctomycetota bacterium]|nr:hypothetical protein [Planctomycetota bacterium]
MCIRDRHKPAQKGVSTHTFIIGGTRGYFLAFDDRFPRMAVPEDVYSLRFGLLLRSRERVAVRKGEWPSFKVKAGGIAEPAWGGPIKAGFSLTQDGRRLTVDNVTFSGEAGEIYVPLSFDIIPVRAFLAQITKDTRTRLETAIPQGTQRFDVGADGRLLPLSFEPPVSGEERVIIEYVSGILGRIMHEERITFVKAKGGGGKELSKP